MAATRWGCSGGKAQQELFVKVATWNGVASLHNDMGKLKERREIIERTSKDTDIVMLQLAHDNLEDYACRSWPLAFALTSRAGRPSPLAGSLFW